MTRNKIIISNIFLLLTLNVCAQKVSRVNISGKLSNFNNRTTVFDLSDIESLRLPNSEREIIPDSDGQFKLSFNLKAPGYFRIGRNEIYLSPGDNLRVKIDNNTPLESKFQGKTSEIQKYLSSTPLEKAGSYLDGGSNIKTSLPETIDFILEESKKRTNLLSEIKNAKPNFIKLEKARITADVILSLNILPGYYIHVKNIQGQLKKDSIFKIADSLTSPIVKKLIPELLNARYLEIETLQHITYTITNQFENSHNPEIIKITDWQFAKELSQAITKIDNKEKLSGIRPKIDSIINPGYRTAVLESYRIKLKFSNGDSVVDFEMVDKDGNKRRLSDYKGKVIFIDLWATWCGPCLKEMPDLDRLRTEFSANKNIVFLSICINDNKELWKKHLIKHGYLGDQYFAEQFQMRDYNVISLPRSIIVDKNFKVNLLDGPLPSNPALAKYLNDLIK